MRYSVALESPSGLAAGAVIASFVPPQDLVVSLRRLIVGGRDAVSPGQVTAAVAYAGSAGTPSGSTFRGQPIGLGQYVGGHSSLFGSAWSAFSSDPSYGSTPTHELSFNSEGGSEKLEWKSGEFTCLGIANNNSGFLVYSVDPAPSGFLYTVTFEVEAF